MQSPVESAAPLVTVVMATYMRQRLLPRAIDSVRRQTLQAWELLVVDDEPSEETASIVASVKDPRIQYLRHRKNLGLCAARNTGIQEATGQYIAFLDDDDRFLPTKLERQVEALNAAPKDVGVISCYEQIHTKDGKVSSRAVDLDGDVHVAICKNDLVRMQLLMVQRECFERVGLFDERLRMHDDFDMTLRLSREYLFRTVREPLVAILATEGSMSTNVEDRIHALETMMATHPELQGTEGARWERRLARHYAEIGRYSEWRRHLFRSLRANPRDPLTWGSLLAGGCFGSKGLLWAGRLRSRFRRLERRRVAGS